MLSPIQPTSGISAFGASTRVPPPPTGSYQNSINNPSAFNAGNSGYAPSGFQSSNSIPSGMAQPGSFGTSGFAQNGSAQTTRPNTVQQTGWVSNNAATAPGSTNGALGNSALGNSGFGSGFNQGAIGSGVNPNAPSNSAPTTTMRPRSGGMNLIDLTRAPDPPGYVPPQNRPGFQSFQSQQTLGQPYNSTTPRSNFGPLPSTQPFGNPAATQPQFLEARLPSEQAFGNAALPSTAPFASTGNQNAANENNDLQWRRPSPRF